MTFSSPNINTASNGIVSLSGIYGGDATSWTSDAPAYEDLVIYDATGDSGLNILSGSNDTGTIAFGDPSDTDVGRITYNHQYDELLIGNSDGYVMLGEEDDFRIESLTLKLDRGGDATSAATLPLDTGYNYYEVDAGGVTDITQFALTSGGSGTLLILKFNDAMTIEDSVSWINLPQDRNISVSEGDVLIFTIMDLTINLSVKPLLIQEKLLKKVQES